MRLGGVSSIIVLLAVCVPGCNCEGRGPKFAGTLGLSVSGANVTGSVPAPCEIDVDFGAVPVGQQAVATVTITNHGKTPVDFSTFTPTLDPQFSLNTIALGKELAASASVDVLVTFGSVRAGPASGSFTIPTNLAPGACQSSASSVIVNLSANGVEVGLDVNPKVIDFGNTVLGTTVTRTATLTNLSSIAVTGLVGSVGGLDANFFTVAVPASLEVGASAEVQVTYAPSGPQAQSTASISISGASGESTGISLRGLPVPVALTVSPATIDFGYVAFETTRVGCTFVLNQANLPVNLKGVSALDSAGGAFALASTDDSIPPTPIALPIAIAPGGSAKICFAMTATIAPATYAGEATLDTDDPGGTSPRVKLVGSGGGPQISCTPGSLSFGERLAQTTTVFPITCMNTGTAIVSATPLVVSAASAEPGVFAAQFDPSVSALQPGDSLRIDVSYSPTGANDDQGSLTIASNGGRGQPVQIPLSGHGLVVQPCQYVLSPAALDFGDVPVGDSSIPLAFEIQNVGADVCVVQSLSTNARSFHLLSTSIQPDPTNGWFVIPAPADGGTSSLTVTLGFSPGASGVYTAEALFTVSDPAAPNQSVALSGTSLSSCLRIWPSSLELGTVAEDGSGVPCGGRSQHFTIFNSCGMDVSVPSIGVQSGPGDLVPQFSVPQGEPLPVTLKAGASSVYSVTFQPTTSGAHTAQLLISDGFVSTLVALAGSVVGGTTGVDDFTVTSPKADVLVVLDVDDDSQEQSALVNGLPVFMQAGSAVDYRFAVTTDDNGPTSATGEFGRLLPCHNCSVNGEAPVIISPSSVPAGGNSPDPTSALINLISSVPANHLYGPDEQFFMALYNALLQPRALGTDFFRPGAFFAAITDNGDDESDLSEEGIGSHDPKWFAGFFEAYFQDPTRFSWNYVNPTPGVTRTGSTDPLELPPAIAQMVAATNGMAVNTSDTQWTVALSSIWTAAIAAGESYPLSGMPTGAQPLAVTLNGVPLLESSGSGTNWTFDAATDTIRFAANAGLVNGDQLEVTYPISCQ